MVEVAANVGWPPEEPVAMPTNGLDGSAPVGLVTSATATPDWPAQPRPVPSDPSAVNPAEPASRSASVMPSPPVPPPIEVVKLAVSSLLGAGTEKITDPD